MQSGEFNKTITIYKEQVVTDEMGFENPTKVVICTDRAKVSHIKSSERPSNNAITYSPRKKLTIRKRNIYIDTDMYINMDNIKYNIIDIDPDSDRLYAHIYVEKVVG